MTRIKILCSLLVFTVIYTIKYYPAIRFNNYIDISPIAASRNQTVSVNRIRNIMVKRKRVVSSQESEFSRFFV